MSCPAGPANGTRSTQLVARSTRTSSAASSWTIQAAPSTIAIPLPARLAVRPAVGVIGREAQSAGILDAVKRVTAAQGREVVLVRTEEGVRAWDAICPHAQFRFGPMRLRRGCELECPMHGARFDVNDGRVLKGPATDPLEPIESRVEGETVLIRVDWLLE